MSAGKLAVMMLGVAAMVGGWSGRVGAQECMTDTECPKGFSCEVTAMSGCTAPAPAPEPATPPACDGGVCGAGQAIVVPCATQQYRSCVPGDCNADSDCADGMVCHERSTGTCSSAPIPPCAPGAMCPDVAPPVCTDTVEHVCMPRYVLPCEQATDCGDGFTCEPQLIMSCSGGSAATPGSAGASAPVPTTPPAPAEDAGQAMDAGAADRAFAPAPPIQTPTPMPVDCTTVPTEEKYCKVIETNCRADSDCPKAFLCQQAYPNATPSACDWPSAGQGDAGLCLGAMVPANPYRCVPRYENIDPGFTGKGGDVGTRTSNPSMPVAAPGSAPITPPVAAPTPGQAVDAGVMFEQGQPAGDNGAAAPNHVKACSVVSPGSNSTDATEWSLLSLLSLAAAWIVVHRRR